MLGATVVEGATVVVANVVVVSAAKTTAESNNVDRVIPRGRKETYGGYMK